MEVATVPVFDECFEPGLNAPETQDSTLLRLRPPAFPVVDSAHIINYYLTGNFDFTREILTIEGYTHGRDTETRSFVAPRSLTFYQRG